MSRLTAALVSIVSVFLLLAAVSLLMPGPYLTYALASVAAVSLLYNEIVRRFRPPPPPGEPDPYTADTPTGWWRVMVLRPREPWYFESYETWLKYVTRHPPKTPPGDVQAGDGKDKESLLERHYKMQVGLYEKYLDLLIKFSIFNFAVTGAILSFYFTHLGNSLISYSLLFPLLMNAFFAVLVLLAYRSLERINKEINYMASFLRFLPPGVDTLRQALLISFMLLLVMVGGLSLAFDLHRIINERFGEEKAVKAATLSGAGAGDAPTPRATTTPQATTMTTPQAPSPSPDAGPSPSPAPGN
jgi:hypothetical protein